MIARRTRAVTLPRVRTDDRAAPSTLQRAARFSWWDLLLPAAVVLWIVSLRPVTPDQIGDLGLLPFLPVAFYLSLALLTASFVAVLARDTRSTIRLTAHVVAAVVALQALVPMTFAMPQYGYVYKHFGVVQYIGLHGSVNGNVDIYQNWPGFFALAAWFDTLAGQPTPLHYAAWAPVYFDLLALLPINLSLRALSLPWRARWLALYVFVVCNWVGQDYFAPQAFAFVLSQGVLACLLTLFRAAPAPWIGRLESRVTSAVHGVYAKARPLVTPQLTRRQRIAALIAVFVPFSVITFSHQLSPYMVIVAACVLAVPGLLRPRWIAAGLVLIAGTYLVIRFNFLHTHEDVLLSFNPFKNAQNTDAAPNDGVFGRVLSGYAARYLSYGVWLLALVGAFRRSRAGLSVLVPMGLFAAPFLIIFGQEYGGEAIYRVYLFSLPWAAGLIAVALAPSVRWTWWASARIGLALTIMTVLFLEAYFGTAEINIVRPTEVTAAQYFYAHAKPGSVLILAAPNYPERDSGIYDHFVVTSGAYDPKLVPNPFFTHRVLGVEDLPAIENDIHAYSNHGYFAITTGMKVYAHVFDLLPDGSLDNLDHSLAASSRWKLFYRNSDAVIYELVAPAPAKPKRG